VLGDSLKLPPDERRQLAARLPEEGGTGSARRDERLEAKREAAGDEQFLVDLSAAMEDFEHAGRRALG